MIQQQSRIVPLNTQPHEEILRVIRDDGGYAQRINGQSASPADVSALLNDRPNGVDSKDHHVLGLLHEGALVGLASLVVGWPRAEVTNLGLLQIAAQYHGRGFGRVFHDMLRAEFPGAYRLTVVDSNAQVIPFWERLGYGRTGEIKQWISNTGVQRQAIVMELASRELLERELSSDERQNE